MNTNPKRKRIMAYIAVLIAFLLIVSGIVWSNPSNENRAAAGYDTNDRAWRVELAESDSNDTLENNTSDTRIRAYKYSPSVQPALQMFAGGSDFRTMMESEPNVSEENELLTFETMSVREMAFRSEDYEAIREADGNYLQDHTSEPFTYQRFEIELDERTRDSDTVQVQWKGKTVEGRKVSLYAWSPSLKNWSELQSEIAGNAPLSLNGEAIVGDFRDGNKMQVIVHEQVEEENEPESFSFVWMSDTQYYSRNYERYYRDIVHWIKDKQEEQQIKYVIHTGDIIDDHSQAKQWVEADANMKVLDDANIPYGVLAGNHDVNHDAVSYKQYWKWFGDERFKAKPTFGDSYKNNRGHYDLVSAGGQDFIIVYMGWGLGKAELGWMDKIVKQYPDRMAILAFHEYLLDTGERAPIGEKVYQSVVLPNKNVVATLSGHYHGAMLKTDAIDDNGDGTPDRNVYQMLADYQNAEDGGLGYIRLLKFDVLNKKLHIQTYSPTLDKFNYYDREQFPEKDEFSLDMEFGSINKRIATDYFDVRINK